MNERDPARGGGARTLALFEIFAEARVPLTLSEISKRTGVPVSSCHALLRTLQANGYVYAASGRRFYPTKRLALVATAIAANDPLLSRITPILEQLAKATGETAILGKMNGGVAIYLDIIEGRHTVRYAAEPGVTRPAHSSAIGKAVLSLLSDGELVAAIARLPLTAVTSKTITNSDLLQADIRESRMRGYFVSRGETVSDVMGIAVGRRIGGEPFGIGVAGPIFRMEAHLTACVTALIEADRSVERVDAESRGGGFGAI